jgi:hypothetical protein
MWEKPVSASHAGSTVISGRYIRHGYFSNSSIGSATLTNSTDIIQNGLSDTSSGLQGTQAQRKASFISQIKNKLNNGVSRDRTGAAFVIQTMRGSPWSRDRTPSAAEVADWEARINNPAVSIVRDGDYTYTWNSGYFSGINDDAHLRFPGERLTLLFQVNGSTRYAFKVDCANPVGSFAGLPAANWSISGDTQIFNYNMSGSALGKTVNATPGQRLSFGYRITNNGPAATNSTISFTRTYNYATGASASQQPFGSSIASGWSSGSTTGWRSSGNTGTITQDHVGGTYTMYVRATPRNQSGSSLLLPLLRVNVPYNFNLTPLPANRSSTSAGTGETVTFSNFRVQNTGPTVSRERTWRIVKLVLEPGTSTSYTQPINLPNTLTDYCAGLRDVTNGPVASCQSQSTGNKVFSPGTYTLTASEVGNGGSADTEDLPPGSNVCMTLGVFRPTEGSTNWRFSQPACVVVGKRPLVHVLGGDILAGGNFPQTDGTCPSIRANIRGTSRPQFGAGSWGEYGAFALGDILDFGTAARPHNSASPSASQRLAFSNTNPVGNFFGSTLRDQCFTDVFSEYGGPNTSSSSSFSISSLNGVEGRQVIRTSAQNITINGGTVSPGRTIVIYATNASANVTINGNIDYTNGNYNTISQLPRVFILSNRNITIHASTTNVDAWLAAKDTLSTCHVTGNLTINNCNNQLLVNGPVSAGTIDLRRTFGADGTTNASRQRPGEIFNLRPDYYLSAYNAALQNSIPRSVYQQELPPRF